ncbi:MAG: immunoglobulin domain-containing protein [Planctomycetota bacterium]
MIRSGLAVAVVAPAACAQTLDAVFASFDEFAATPRVVRVELDGSSKTLVLPSDADGMWYDRAGGELQIMFDASLVFTIDEVDFTPSTPTRTQIFSFVGSGAAANAVGLAFNPGTNTYTWGGDGGVYSALAVPGATVNAPAPNPFRNGLHSYDLDVAQDVEIYATRLDIFGDFNGFLAPVNASAAITATGIDPVSGDTFWAEAFSGTQWIYRLAGFTGTPVLVATLNEGAREITAIDAFGKYVGYALETTFFVSDLRVYDTTTQQTTQLLSDAQGKIREIDLETSGDVPSDDLVLSIPQSVFTDEGQSASFTVEVSPLVDTFQWLKNGEPVVDDGRITGANTDTLTINPVALIDNDTYSLSVGGFGLVDESIEAILLVRDVPGVGACNVADTAAPFGVLDLGDIDAFIGAFQAGCSE